MQMRDSKNAWASRKTRKTHASYVDWGFFFPVQWLKVSKLHGGRAAYHSQ